MNLNRCQFHQHFTSSFYSCRSQKHKKYSQAVSIFCTFGFCMCKKLLVKCWWNWNQISESLERSWKEVGERLRLSPDHLNYLERENLPAVRNRNAPYRMLYFWTQKNDKNATVGKLTKALYRAGDYDTIKKMRPWPSRWLEKQPINLLTCTAITKWKQIASFWTE